MQPVDIFLRIPILTENSLSHLQSSAQLGPQGPVVEYSGVYLWSIPSDFGPNRNPWFHQLQWLYIKDEKHFPDTNCHLHFGCLFFKKFGCLLQLQLIVPNYCNYFIDCICFKCFNTIYLSYCMIFNYLGTYLYKLFLGTNEIFNQLQSIKWCKYVKWNSRFDAYKKCKKKHHLKI